MGGRITRSAVKQQHSSGGIRGTKCSGGRTAAAVEQEHTQGGSKTVGRQHWETAAEAAAVEPFLEHQRWYQWNELQWW